MKKQNTLQIRKKRITTISMLLAVVAVLIIGFFSINYLEQMRADATANNSGQYITDKYQVGSLSQNRVIANNTADITANIEWQVDRQIIQIATGASHSLALTSDGSVWAWGYNGSGQLGIGVMGDRATPSQVDFSMLPAGVEITQLEAGEQESVALASDGSVWAWGRNTYGQLGDGTNADRSIPTQVDLSSLPEGVTITQIATGFTHTLAVASDGSAWAWGHNIDGQLGNGTYDNSSTPIRIDFTFLTEGVSITSVAAGNRYSLAIDSEGKGWAWGSNWTNQLGDGTMTARNSPVAIDLSMLPEGVTISKIVAGNVHTVALMSDGSLWAWGDNYFGQLGDGTNLRREMIAVQVDLSALSADAYITDIASGSNHVFAIASDGTAIGWGSNYEGQLGDTSRNDHYTPTLLDLSGLNEGTSVSQIAPGEAQTIMLTTDDSVVGWGANWSGRLGNGTFDDNLGMTKMVTHPTPTVTGITVGDTEATDISVEGNILSFTAPALNVGTYDVIATFSDDSTQELQDITYYKVPVTSVNFGSQVVQDGLIVETPELDGIDSNIITSSSLSLLNSGSTTPGSPVCQTINTSNLLTPDSVDSASNYSDTVPSTVSILGGLEFTLTCTSSAIADIEYTLGAASPSDKQFVVYKLTNNTLKDITDRVSIANQYTTPVIQYSLLDGGEFDEDGAVNGTIVDPIYIGLKQKPIVVDNSDDEDNDQNNSITTGSQGSSYNNTETVANNTPKTSSDYSSETYDSSSDDASDIETDTDKAESSDNDSSKEGSDANSNVDANADNKDDNTKDSSTNILFWPVIIIVTIGFIIFCFKRLKQKED